MSAVSSGGQRKKETTSAGSREFGQNFSSLFTCEQVVLTEAGMDQLIHSMTLCISLKKRRKLIYFNAN
jgi:hypothetical protein